MSKPTTYKIHPLFLHLLRDFFLKEEVRGSRSPSPRVLCFFHLGTMNSSCRSKLIRKESWYASSTPLLALLSKEFMQTLTRYATMSTLLLSPNPRGREQHHH